MFTIAALDNHTCFKFSGPDITAESGSDLCSFFIKLWIDESNIHFSILYSEPKYSGMYCIKKTFNKEAFSSLSKCGRRDQIL